MSKRERSTEETDEQKKKETTWVSPLAKQLEEINVKLDRRIREGVKAALDPITGPTTPIILRVCGEEQCDERLYALTPFDETIGLAILHTLIYLYEKNTTKHISLIDSLVTALYDDEATPDDEKILTRYFGRVTELGTLRKVYNGLDFVGNGDGKRLMLQYSRSSALDRKKADADTTKNVDMDDLATLLYIQDCTTFE